MGREGSVYCGRVAIEESGVSKSSRYGAKRRGGLSINYTTTVYSKRYNFLLVFLYTVTPGPGGTAVELLNSTDRNSRQQEAVNKKNNDAAKYPSNKRLTLCLVAKYHWLSPISISLLSTTVY